MTTQNKRYLTPREYGRPLVLARRTGASTATSENGRRLFGVKRQNGYLVPSTLSSESGVARRIAYDLHNDEDIYSEEPPENPVAAPYGEIGEEIPYKGDDPRFAQVRRLSEWLAAGIVNAEAKGMRDDSAVLLHLDEKQAWGITLDGAKKAYVELRILLDTVQS